MGLAVAVNPPIHAVVVTAAMVDDAREFLDTGHVALRSADDDHARALVATPQEAFVEYAHPGELVAEGADGHGVELDGAGHRTFHWLHMQHVAVKVPLQVVGSRQGLEHVAGGHLLEPGADRLRQGAIDGHRDALPGCQFPNDLMDGFVAEIE